PGTGRADVARDRALVVGPQRRLPRHPVHAPVPRADLAVRLAGRLLVQDRPEVVAVAVRPESDGGRDRRVSLGATWHGGTVAAAAGRLDGERGRALRRGPLLLPV